MPSKTTCALKACYKGFHLCSVNSRGKNSEAISTMEDDKSRVSPNVKVSVLVSDSEIYSAGILFRVILSISPDAEQVRCAL